MITSDNKLKTKLLNFFTRIISFKEYLMDTMNPGGLWYIQGAKRPEDFRETSISASTS